MGLPKGRTNNPAGKPSGTISRKTKEWEALGDAITTRHAERFNNILANFDDDKFADKFLQVIEYFQPKLARVENKHEGDLGVQLEVKQVDL